MLKYFSYDHLGFKDVDLKTFSFVSNSYQSILICSTLLWICFLFFCFFSFLLNLLGWHWLTKLYRFQVHNAVSSSYYLVCLHPKSSIHPSPFILPYILPHLTCSRPPQSPHCGLCPWVFSLFPPQSLYPPPSSPLTFPTESCLPAFYVSVSVLLV